MPDWEPFAPLVELCRKYGIDKHAAYRGVRDGTLDARLPRGCKRGYRCRESEFRRWLEEVYFGRCD